GGPHTLLPDFPEIPQTDGRPPFLRCISGQTSGETAGAFHWSVRRTHSTAHGSSGDPPARLSSALLRPQLPRTGTSPVFQPPAPVSGRAPQPELPVQEFPVPSFLPGSSAGPAQNPDSSPSGDGRVLHAPLPPELFSVPHTEAGWTIP